MKNRTASILAGFVFLALGSVGNATVRSVHNNQSAQYTTISSALSESSAGDTIVLLPGCELSFGSLSITNPIHIIGAGFQPVTQGGVSLDGYIILSSSAANSSIEGIAIKLYSGSSNVTITNNANNLLLSRCLIMNSYTSYGGGYCVSNSGDNFIMERCFLKRYMDTYGSAGVINYGSGCHISNSIFTSTSIDYSASIQYRNCIFKSTYSYSVGYGASVQNCIYTGESALPGSAVYCASLGATVPTNQNNIQLASSPFVSDTATTELPFRWNLHLVTGSPCIDGGNPNGMSDRDETRNDMGIYGGQTPFVDNGTPAFPFVTGFELPSSVPAGQPMQLRATGRVGQR